MAIDLKAKAVFHGLQVPSGDLFGVLACGHSSAATIVHIELGERREGGDWKVVGQQFEAACSECGEKGRFTISEA